MKKTFLFFSVLLAFVLAGCNEHKESEKAAAVAITLSETSVRMPIVTWDEKKGEETATEHSFTIMPADSTYTVEASVANIVAIQTDKNTVRLTAQNMGKTILTITETQSGATAQYAVEVVSVLESVVFTQAVVSYHFNEYKQNEYEVVENAFSYTDRDGNDIPLKAYVVDADVSLFSDGFYMTDEGLYTGASVGYIAAFPATGYYAPAYLNADKGYPYDITYSSDVWSTQQKSSFHKLKGGYIANEEGAIAHIKQAVDYSNQDNWEMYGEEMHFADSIAFKGGLIYKYIKAADGYSKYVMPSALITEAAFNLLQGGNTSSTYMYLVSEAEMYLYPLTGYYGLGVDLAFDTEKKIWYVASDKLQFGERIHYKHKLDIDFAPQKEAVRIRM